ncbi:hypothetical protein [Streptomyces sp. V1I6]|uniref:hypothetical protein n=1 Tax=Streptomyces sp. V1I6 TaxID=3042273 RepID=UPI0027D7DE77|nr:hypothetical protein [Streptomyces sp. V1I6]
MAERDRVDPIALAEADAIRARTEAETEARLAVARAEAEAVRIKAAEEAEKLRLVNERQRMALEEKKAAHLKKIAAEKAEADEIERRAKAAANAAAADEADAAKAARAVQGADDSWRTWAIRFAIVCGIVALPVQMNAFWNENAPWMVAAPIMLEGGAWVVHRGARAAAVSGRPVWHYRVIIWALAFIAAGINLYHGLHAFDPGTAIGTAIASIAGPGVWDLYEHGNLRKSNRKERRARRRAEALAAALEAEREALAQQEKAAAAQAAAEAAAKLAADRERYFPKVWEHAVKLAAALGETTVTEAIWKRAHNDIEGTDPTESVDIIRGRNAAARRVIAARSEAPGEKPRRVTSSQIVPQVPNRGKRGRAGGPPVRGVRRKGDTTFSVGARKQQSITARIAVSEEQS